MLRNFRVYIILFCFFGVWSVCRIFSREVNWIYQNVNAKKRDFVPFFVVVWMLKIMSGVKKLILRKDKDTNNLFRQINENEYIYVSNFDTKSNTGRQFSLEHFEGNKLLYKIKAERISFIQRDSTYRLINYTLRTVGEMSDKIIQKRRKDTLFNFDIEDLTPPKYAAEILSYSELNDFIKKEKERGSSNIGRYQVVQFKKWSLPVSI